MNSLINLTSGPLGLYRGLLPQLTGVMPEKAVLLFVNDLVRAKLTTSDGQISARCEIVAGAVGGTFQSLISNPLEIVKVRLQTAGEVAAKQKVSVVTIILAIWHCTHLKRHLLDDILRYI